MVNTQPSPKVFLRNLRMIHLGLFSGLTIFAAIAYYLRHKLIPSLETGELDIVTYLSLFIILTQVPLGYWLHTRKMKSMEGLSDLPSKLSAYQVSHIIKIALFEGAGFLSAIVLLLGGRDQLMFQIAIVLVFILLNTPSVTKVTNELNLTQEESEQLNV